MNFGTGSKFGTDVAKRYGEGSEVLVFSSRKKRQENGTDTKKLRWWQNSTDSRAVLFLVRKGPLGNDNFLSFFRLSTMCAHTGRRECGGPQSEAHTCDPDCLVQPPNTRMALKLIGEGASSLFGGRPGSLENVSCSRATPDLHRCNLEVALEQETFSRLPGLHPKRPLAPSPINLGEVQEFRCCTRVSGSQTHTHIRTLESVTCLNWT